MTFIPCLNQTSLVSVEYNKSSQWKTCADSTLLYYKKKKKENRGEERKKKTKRKEDIRMVQLLLYIDIFINNHSHVFNNGRFINIFFFVYF